MSVMVISARPGKACQEALLVLNLLEPPPFHSRIVSHPKVTTLALSKVKVADSDRVSCAGAPRIAHRSNDRHSAWSASGNRRVFVNNRVPMLQTNDRAIMYPFALLSHHSYSRHGPQ